MKDQLNINQRVLSAQQNTDEADRLIREYLPFIKSETAKIIGRIPKEGQDDELSIALMGFHEAIESFDESRGTVFFTFASMVIYRRIIDFMRHEKRFINENISSYEKIVEDEKGGVELVTDSDVVVNTETVKWEILQLIKELGQLGITMSEVAANCPKQPKTMADCITAVEFIVAGKEFRKELLTRGLIPVTRIVTETSVKKKTLERHRKYLVALSIIYLRGYDSLIGHLAEVFKSTKGGK